MSVRNDSMVAEAVAALLREIRSWKDYKLNINHIVDAFEFVEEALWDESGSRRDIRHELELARYRVKWLEEELQREEAAKTELKEFEEFIGNRERELGCKPSTGPLFKPGFGLLARKPFGPEAA